MQYIDIWYSGTPISAIISVSQNKTWWLTTQPNELESISGSSQKSKFDLIYRVRSSSAKPENTIPFKIQFTFMHSTNLYQSYLSVLLAAIISLHFYFMSFLSKWALCPSFLLPLALVTTDGVPWLSVRCEALWGISPGHFMCPLTKYTKVACGPLHSDIFPRVLTEARKSS